MKKKITPMNATQNQLAGLTHDNVCVGDFSIMTDSEVVWLSEQKRGFHQKQHIEIPRSVFNKLISWYVGGKVPREDARSR